MMSKTKKYFLRFLAVCVGVVLGMFFFFPWSLVAENAIDIAQKIAAQNGIFLTVSSAEEHGVFAKHFVYEDMNADFPVFRLKTNSMTVTPHILSSLVGSKKCTFEFARGSIVLLTRQELAWNSGSAVITMNSDTLGISDISFTGKTNVTGFLELSRSDLAIVRAKVVIKADPGLDRAFELVRTMTSAPLTKTAAGEWRLER
ncbi:MAG: type II secretion system protein GspN [Synergistes sp.]|nr:type II secretion system protein GspN [Synergistes sp.]